MIAITHYLISAATCPLTIPRGSLTAARGVKALPAHGHGLISKAHIHLGLIILPCEPVHRDCGQKGGVPGVSGCVEP